jgi:N-acyl-D-amino-acid deacylase
MSGIILWYSESSTMLDVIIRNARIIDGTGNPWFRGDVGIQGDTIASVGEGAGNAERVIDAEGLYLCPGFIDVHCHPDFTVLDASNPRDFKLRQGITTEVGGNCGETAAPVNPSRLDLLKAFVAFEAPREGVLSWEWLTCGDYLDLLSRCDIPTNFVPLVGHSTVRIAAMGFDNRSPTSSELGEMQCYVQEAMEAGAFGLSAGLGYAPGAYASTQEIIELARVAARYSGIYATHMRNYSDEVMEALEESFEVGRQAQIPVVVSHISVSGPGNAGKIKDALAAIERARDAGLDVTTDVLISAGTTLRVLLPHWASQGTLDDLYQRLRDPATRKQMKEEMGSGAVHQRSVSEETRWKNIYISRVMSEANKRFQGMSIEEISEMRGTDPADTVMDLVQEEQCQVSMFGRYRHEEDLRTALAHPLTMIETDAMGYVEGYPPPGQYGTFPRVLGRYVREEKLLGLEEAVHKMTSYPARSMRLSKKGLIRSGFDADLVVFNADTIEDLSTFENPRQYPKGIEYVLVNGQVVVERGDFSGKMAGRVIRRGR